MPAVSDSSSDDETPYAAAAPPPAPSPAAAAKPAAPAPAKPAPAKPAKPASKARAVPITANMLMTWLDTKPQQPAETPEEKEEENQDEKSASNSDPSRIAHCAAKDVRSEIDALRSAGFRDVRAFPLNIATRSFGSSGAAQMEEVHELRGGGGKLEELRPGANLDVREDIADWLPGHAETMGIVASAWDIADLICSAQRTAAVVFSTKGGDGARTLASCARAALRKIDKKKASTALKGKAPAPKHAKLKAFVKEFEKCARADVFGSMDKFYHASM